MEVIADCGESKLEELLGCKQKHKQQPTQDAFKKSGCITGKSEMGQKPRGTRGTGLIWREGRLRFFKNCFNMKKTEKYLHSIEEKLEMLEREEIRNFSYTGQQVNKAILITSSQIIRLIIGL